MVQKIIKTKVKANFLLFSILEEISQGFACNKQSIKNTKSFFPKVLIRDLKIEKSKSQVKLVNAQLLLAKTFNKACKKDKKE